jgi:hypothetical protein
MTQDKATPTDAARSGPPRSRVTGTLRGRYERGGRGIKTGVLRV